MSEKAKKLVVQMTLEEKASLCSGRNFWQLKSIERLGLKSIMVTDGPHGLRKQVGDADHLGIAQSVPATCFPAACATACSFDTDLLTDIGRAMGEECLQEDVSVILGPGVNIKRSPLCGRNFEYFSEDPLLSGKLGTALINGVQEKGVGTSIKHYVGNEQETKRMVIDTIADERAMREIYLKAFEIPVKESQPWTVMCSYNKINNVYAADNKEVLTDILRDEWNFEGLVMTDWGAINDRVQGVRAGLDLEMPGSRGVNDAKIVEAVKDGSLKEEELDKVVERVVDLILKYQPKSGYKYDADEHHTLARRAAAESCVLLKNDNHVLPLKDGDKLAVIGSFAKTPRYQGAGSSKINPIKMDNAFDELGELGFDTKYAQGYNSDNPDDGLIAEAVKIAQESDVAIIFAGLPDAHESEGFDRKTLDMPKSHVKLIRAVAEVKPETVVVLQLGSPVKTDWAKEIKGLVVSYLGGQAGGGGIADVLSGKVNPGGKLSESWPLELEDNPSYHYFPGGSRTVEYRESIFVGYRYYETAKKPVAWPFGFGLSYTTFEYSDINVSSAEVTFDIKNTGKVAGAEVAQIYLSLPTSKIYRPSVWLVGFEKVRLAPGESKTVTVKLDQQAFAYYNAVAKGWRVEGGPYTVYVGAAVDDMRLSSEVEVAGDGDEALLASLSKTRYFEVTDNTFPDFATIYGEPLPETNRHFGAPYTVNDTLEDIKHTPIGKRILEETLKNTESMGDAVGEDIKAMMSAMVMDMPLRGMGLMGGEDMPPNFAELLIGTLNGGFFSRMRGTLKFMSTMKAKKKG